MNTELDTLCARLIGCLLNGLYQGLLLWLLMLLLSRCWTRASAATRHALWFITLLLLALLIPAHYFLDKQQPANPPAGQAQPEAASPDQMNARPLVNLSEVGLGPEPGSNPLPDLSGVEWLDRDLADLPAPAANFGGNAVASAAPPPVVAARGGAAWRDRLRCFAANWLSPIWWNTGSPVASGIITGLSVLWFCLAAVRLVLVAGRLWQLKTLVRRARLPVDAGLSALFQTLLVQLEVSRPVELRVTSEQRSAVLVGVLRPCILLSEETIKDPGEAGHVLRHELAHLQRWDDWTNLIQHLAQAIFFFHPAVLWIGRRLALEREIACDDRVLQLGTGRRDYAMILANVAARVQQSTPLLAPGVSHSRSQLQQRISMILNTRRNSSPKLAKAGLVSAVSLAGVAAGLFVYSAPRLVLAADSETTSAAISSGTPTLAAPTTPTPAPAEPDVASSAAVSVAAAPEAPVAAAAGVEPGPKFKPDAPAAEPPEPGEAGPGQPPETPVDLAPRPPMAPRVARAGRPGRNSQPADAMDVPDNNNASIEERLRRLEKMVRSLMDQQNPKRMHSAFSFKDGGNQNWNADQDQLDKLKDLADRQSARAAEQAQRALEQADRVKKQLAARRDEPGLEKGELRESLQKQLEALRQAREGLGREMERLDRQIQKLQQEQERGDKDTSRRRGSATGDRLHADISVVPDIAVTAEAAK